MMGMMMKSRWRLTKKQRLMLWSKSSKWRGQNVNILLKDPDYHVEEFNRECLKLKFMRIS